MMDIEIIPNWHPIFVHFTVALLSLSALLYLAGLVLRRPNLLIAARWNLWIGAGITIGTVLAGFYAYNTVAHDGPSHAAMTDHKNWALVTAFIFGVLAIWSLAKHRGAKSVSVGFVVLILLASGLLAVTGYKGGEVVYRHGMGVMRMPEISGDGGHGSHAHGEDADGGHHGASETNEHEDHEVKAQPAHDHSSHDH
jgi:uncharacterized membrane protein